MSLGETANSINFWFEFFKGNILYLFFAGIAVWFAVTYKNWKPDTEKLIKVLAWMVVAVILLFIGYNYYEMTHKSVDVFQAPSRF